MHDLESAAKRATEDRIFTRENEEKIRVYNTILDHCGRIAGLSLSIRSGAMAPEKGRSNAAVWLVLPASATIFNASIRGRLAECFTLSDGVNIAREEGTGNTRIAFSVLDVMMR